MCPAGVVPFSGDTLATSGWLLGDVPKSDKPETCGVTWAACTKVTEESQGLHLGRARHLVKLSLKDKLQSKKAAIVTEDVWEDCSLFCRWGSYGLDQYMNKLRTLDLQAQSELSGEEFDQRKQMTEDRIQEVRNRLVQGDWKDIFKGLFTLRESSVSVADYQCWLLLSETSEKRKTDEVAERLKI